MIFFQLISSLLPIFSYRTLCKSGSDRLMRTQETEWRWNRAFHAVRVTTARRVATTCAPTCSFAPRHLSMARSANISRIQPIFASSKVYYRRLVLPKWIKNSNMTKDWIDLLRNLQRSSLTWITDWYKKAILELISPKLLCLAKPVVEMLPRIVSNYCETILFFVFNDINK